MAQNKEHQPHQENKKTSNNTNNAKKSTPMIVARVNQIPVVKLAVSMGFSQYGKLKSSNVTVGELMTRAEGWAFYVWSKVQPIVEKLQDPINRGDQLACSALDFVEGKYNAYHRVSN